LRIPDWNGDQASLVAIGRPHSHYFDSLCDVCFRQKRQNLLSSSRSVVFFLFFVVL
jgi:hypothetical protein